MAASRSPRQLREIGSFIEALYEMGGYKTWKEFADEARIAAPQVSEFKNGVAEPSGYNLLRLIQVAAARADKDAAGAATQLIPQSTLRLLEGIQGDLSQLLFGQAEGIEILERLDPARPREQPAPGRPARTRRVGGRKAQ